MKVWIDDIRDAPDDSWTEVRKVQPAIEFISRYWVEIDEISFDHDIENRPDDETFRPIAHYVGVRYEGMRNRGKPCPKLTIHSINPTGAIHIQDILSRYGLKSERKPYAPDLERMKREFGTGDLMDGEVK